MSTARNTQPHHTVFVCVGGGWRGGGERGERRPLAQSETQNKSEQHKVKYEGVKIVIIIKKLEVMKYPYCAT